MSDTLNATASKQVALGAIFVVMTMLATVVGLSCRFGMHGFAFGVDISVLLWIIASSSGVMALRPFSNRHLSITEIVTLLAICLILHGLALPAVQSRQHNRRPATMPATTGGMTATTPTP